MTLTEYQTIGKQVGWKMRCPNCGNVASPASFDALGIDPQKAAQECIGRYQLPNASGSTMPCDYVAYGLIAIDGMIEVEISDEKFIWAFPFAD